MKDYDGLVLLVFGVLVCAGLYLGITKMIHKTMGASRRQPTFNSYETRMKQKRFMDETKRRQEELMRQQKQRQMDYRRSRY